MNKLIKKHAIESVFITERCSFCVDVQGFMNLSNFVLNWQIYFEVFRRNNLGY